MVVRLFLLAVIALFSIACGSPEIQFAVKHLRDDPGEQVTEVFSSANYPGLDNSAATAPLQVQMDLERDFNYEIDIQLSSEDISEQAVEEKIIELYKLPGDLSEEQSARCALSVVVPAGHKATITIEWTERRAQGVVNEGAAAEGDRLGTYEVFLGYIEPCSLISQDNTP